MSDHQDLVHHASMSADATKEVHVPRFIFPDYMVRMRVKEIDAALEEPDHPDKEHLSELRVRCKEHLHFQKKLREVHRAAGPTLNVAIAPHGEEEPSAHASVSAGGRVIAIQPEQVIGNMMTSIDKDIPADDSMRRRRNTYMELPGKIVKPEFDPASQHVYKNALAVYQYYREVHNRDSLNNRHLKLVSSIHYAQQYGNAFWSSPDLQMVYGDGDPAFLVHIVEAMDIAGHEMTHGIIDQECKLEYQDESGALNESIADVFGLLVKQWDKKQSVSQSDWLLGVGTVPSYGKSLRSFTSEPAFRGDPQPKTYEGIDEWMQANARAVSKDYGGVHLLSGIPNHAFFKFCKTFHEDFHAYDGLPAKIWYGIVVGRKIRRNASFYEFAHLTVEKARELGGKVIANNLQQSWADVGIYLDEGVRAARASAAR